MRVMDEWQFHAPGTPATKGSWRIRRRKGKVWLDSDNKNERPWAATVAWAAKELWRDRPLIDSGVDVSIVFEMLRPAKPARGFPTGDVDKLSRSCLDALTGILWVDDVLVVTLTATKRYVERDPGAWVRFGPHEDRSSR
jgi:crossover junction endodeoxyribonuclease RusA